MNSQHSVSFNDTSIAFSSKSDRQLKKLHFIFGIMNYPLLVNLGTNFLKIALKLHLPVKPLIKQTIFEIFCGGETIYDCREKSMELSKYGIGTILDYSVEGTENEKDFERTARELLEVVDKSGIEPKNPFVVFKLSGIASNKVMGKLQAGAELTHREQQSWQRTRERLNQICSASYQKGVKVLIDAEESWIQQPIDQVTYEMMGQYNKEAPLVYNTFQMYRKDMISNLQEAYQTAVNQGYHLGVKLVRGAYMEKERERAEDLRYADPIHVDKQSVDQDFNQALEFCVRNIQYIGLCCGSHNEYSNQLLTELMGKSGLQPDNQRIHFAQLYGMSDNISFNLANAGYNVAKYLPYGPVADVIPYLFRRAEENTAIAGQTSREYTLIHKEIPRRATEAKTT